jgi:hypothetical protein
VGSQRGDHPVSADLKNCGIEHGFSWMNELLRPDTHTDDYQI